MKIDRIVFVLLLGGLGAGSLPAQDSSEACSVCHRTHYQQWLQSPHSQSWKSAEFQAQLKTFGSTEFCGRCHAPASIWKQVDMQAKEGFPAPEDYRPELGNTPIPRMDTLEDGVNCGSCHFVEVLWPYGGANETLGPYHTDRGHGGKPAKAFDNFALCGACHGRAAADYRPEGLAENSGFYHDQTSKFAFAAGESDCAGCHMPASQGLLTTLRVFKDLPERTVREHSFIGDRWGMLAEKLGFELETGANGARLIVTNRGVGHPLRVKPSTRLILEVMILRGGTVADALSVEVPVGPELAFGESHSVPLGTKLEAGDSLRVEVVRKGPNNFRDTVLERTLEP